MKTLPERAVAEPRVKRKAGRPRKVIKVTLDENSQRIIDKHFSVIAIEPQTSEQTISLIASYISYCEESMEMPNFAGFFYYTGVSNLWFYNQDDNGEISKILQQFKHFIHNKWVQRLPKGHPQGTIFYLKNVFGYDDDSGRGAKDKGGGDVVFLIAPETAKRHDINVGNQTADVSPVDPKLAELPPPQVDLDEDDGMEI